MLHRGQIVERGNHDELMAQGGRYFRMYQLQLGAGAGNGPGEPAPESGDHASAAGLRPSLEQI